MYRHLDVDPIDVDPDGIAENQTLAGAGDLTLNGALCDLNGGTFDVAVSGYGTGIGGVRIAIDSVGDISTVNFTVTGTNQDGIAITQVLTGVTTTAVESTVYWKTVTQIASDAAVASAVFVGPVDKVITPTIVLNWRSNYSATMMVTTVTGTLQYDILESLINVTATQDFVGGHFDVSQSNKTAVLIATALLHATAIRLRLDSYSSGADLHFEVRQNDYN